MNTRSFGDRTLVPQGKPKQQARAEAGAPSHRHLKNYPYFGNETTRQTPLTAERIARNRRVRAFSVSSGLRPIKAIEDCPLIERTWQALNCDHVSVWTSGKGIRFVLNEPYGKTCVNEQGKLRDAGLVRIEIPIPLSPYCGQWSEAQGAQPETRSFLIGFKCDEAELLAIATKLRVAAASASAWNDTGTLL